MKAEINGITINYHEVGEGDPVIFLHAFPLNQTMWDDQVVELADGFRLLTLDLRGFGGSGVTAGTVTMSQMAADVYALMKRLSIERATLVGLSMGGYVALAFYRDYPECVRALVLAATRATADTAAAQARRLQSADQAEREGANAIADAMVSLLLGASTTATRSDLAARLRSMIVANSPQGIAAAQRGMAARPDSTPLLPQMRFPVLVIIGAEDSLTSVAEAEGWRSQIPNSTLQVIEGAGHLLNLEKPLAFNAALQAFLASLRG